jgi:hypothetical protein
MISNIVCKKTYPGFSFSLYSDASLSITSKLHFNELTVLGALYVFSQVKKYTQKKATGKN